MEILREAVALNNQAIQHLQNGNLAEGFTTMQEAMAASREFASQTSNEPSDLSPLDDGGSAMGSNAHHHARCFHARFERLLDHHNGCLYIYDRAIVLPNNFTSTMREDLESIAHSTHCLVLFNMALFCHQMGVESGQDSLLMRAARLYTMIVYILDGTENAALGVLKCVALNNCAAIHYERCDYESSGECSEALVHQLTSSTPCCYLETFLDRAEARGVLRNVEQSNPPSLAGAA